MAEAVCKGILNLRIRRRLEKARHLAAVQETNSIFQAAEEREGGAQQGAMEDAQSMGGAAAGGDGMEGEGGDAEGGEGSSKAEKVVVGGVGGAKTAKNVAQAKLMLEKLDYGVAALMMSILRADETLNILAEN